MSKFNVPVLRLHTVSAHPNADKLELAQIGGYKAVVGKGQFNAGDLVAYIPTDAVVPASLAERLNIAAYLVGPDKNRVKAIRLRGILSEGIVLAASLFEGAKENDDLAEVLGITKYEPPIPVSMQGLARGWPSFLPHYDIENIKRPEFRPLLAEGTPVSITEKLHGTNVAYAWGPGLDADEPLYVCSRSLALKYNEHNLYWLAALRHDIPARLASLRDVLASRLGVAIDHLSLHGEVLGCQDLKYGATNACPLFAAFDIRVNGEFLDPNTFRELCALLSIPTVPELYQGPFNYEALDSLSKGKDTLTHSHIREGLVIKPLTETYDPVIGRLVLKYVSDDYLTRKGGSELH